MAIFHDLLARLAADAPVRSVLVGAHWTVVCSRHAGMASTTLGNKPHGHGQVREVGSLHQKSARELAEFVLSDNLLEVSIGLAAINSLLDVDEVQAVEINAKEVLNRYGQGKNIALVGHFPFIASLRQAARQLWVIEQQPVEGEFPADQAQTLIPQADVVAITGSALINGTLDHLLSLARRDIPVLILGPSTPLSPVLFDHGASMISGVRVVDEASALLAVSQGASFQQVGGVRLVTLAKPGLSVW